MISKATHRRAFATAMRGVSLVELMVGMVIGMIAIVVVMQVFALSENNKRTTTGTDDAQTNGAIALTGLQRDIRQAGYNISNYGVIGCNVTPPPPATWTINTMAPVVINHPNIPAGDANTDTVMIAYGSSNGSSEGDRVITQPPATPMVFTVTTPESFGLNDNVIALTAAMTGTIPRPSPCTVLMEPVINVTVSPNPPNVTVAAPGTAGMTDGTLFNLGRAPVVRVYAIRGGALTQCNYLVNDCSLAANVANPAIWVPVGDNIVSLRAEYGRDTSVPMDMVADVYDQTSPVGTDACGWTRVSALRIVLVARNTQMDKQDITAAAPPWSGASATPINLSATNANWTKFRYKTLETTVPIRNMAWQGVQTSCP
jgi:type IV pilus assembly protein PilW